MRVEQFNWCPKIEDIKIKSKSSGRRFITGEFFILKGTCRIVPSDFGEESFIMNFIYEGKPDEPSYKLFDYLRNISWWENRKINYEPSETLMEFVESNLK